VATFEAQNPYLDANVLVFRALGVDLPSWAIVHPDMGWSGLAKSVRVSNLESDHLSIVRSPHAEKIADVLMLEIAKRST
jgi:thioesterase domain-containing protein